MSEDESQLVDPRTAKHNRAAGDGFRMSWPALTVTLAVVTLASAGSLVIVATIADADALATVALVLAILAFGAQLIGTAAQNAAASEQYRQMNRLYEDTRAVLNRIRTQSKMLLSNQSDQFNKILDHVLSPGAIESAVAEARGESSEADAGSISESAPETDVNQVAKLLRAEADRALAEERAKGPSARVVRKSPPQEELKSFPTKDEVDEVLPLFNSLSDKAKSYLRDIATRFARNPQTGIRLGLIARGEIGQLQPHLRELRDAGFISLEPIRRDGATDTVRRLTTHGVTAVRFFTGQGIVPEYLRGVFAEPSTDGDSHSPA